VRSPLNSPLGAAVDFGFAAFESSGYVGLFG
jgi:hypothetical protein